MAEIVMTMVLVLATGFGIGYGMRELKSQRGHKSVKQRHAAGVSFRRNA